MNWLIILTVFAASYANPENDATTISQLSQESVSNFDDSEVESTSTSYVDVSQRKSVATTVLESSLETSTSLTPEVTTKLETLETQAVTERESEKKEQAVEFKTDNTLLPSSKVILQGTEIKETTVASLNENNEVSLSSVVESQSIDTLTSTEESATVSEENSVAPQSFQTEPVTEEINKIETDITTVQPAKIPVSSNTIENQNHLAVTPVPSQTIPESTEGTHVESSSVSVIPISEISQTETSAVVQPNTEETVSVAAVSETSQLFSVQTESSSTVSSSSQEPSPLPLVPEVSQPSTDQIKTKPDLLEVLGGTVTSATQDPVQSLNTLLPVPSTHGTVEHRNLSIDQNATIVHQENIRNTNGSYKHGFETSNGILFHEEGVPRDYNKTDEESGKPARNIVVTGAFGWTAPNGEKIGIKYYADETGYHPEGDVIPTPPPSPPQILKALAWIRKVLAEKKEKEQKLKGEHLDN